MRLDDWDIRLNTYIEQMRYEPFKWGSNDCLTFAGAVLEAQYGDNIIADWRGTYTNRWGAFLNYKRKLRKFDCRDIIDGLDKRFNRLDTWLPARGSLVLRPQDNALMGYIFGVCISENVVFLGADGLEFTPVKHNDMFWSLVQ